jgi:hypothetical protein
MAQLIKYEGRLEYLPASSCLPVSKEARSQLVRDIDSVPQDKEKEGGRKHRTI